jgi:cation:H+ antiporter
MNLFWSLLLSLAGLLVLTKAADMFVDGAVALSNRLGLSPVLIGAVVIGLGTSIPELLVSVLAAADGDVALGVGNVVGSNIANLSLVLGVAALLTPIAVSNSTLRREAPLSFAAVALFGYLLHDGLEILDAVLLLGALVVVVAIIIATTTRSGAETLHDLAGEDIAEVFHRPAHRIGLVTAIGLVGTVAGAQVLVTGALGVAEGVGLSEGFVGITLVAVGTSLPELVTAVQAARRNEHELIVGNVLGSNLFNSLAVGGAIALFAPGSIGDPGLTGSAVVMMVGVALLGWIVMWRGPGILRIEGLLLLAGYVATVWLLL